MAPAGLVGQATVTETGRVRVLRFAMAASQSALAMMLLIGAALLGRSYLKLTTQETGFSGDVLALSTSYPAAHVGALLQRDIETTIERLQRITGVQSVAATFGGIIDKSRTMALLRVHGRQVPITPKLVTMGYFDAVGTRLLSGRALTPHDRNYSGIVVNESFEAVLAGWFAD